MKKFFSIYFSATLWIIVIALIIASCVIGFGWTIAFTVITIVVHVVIKKNSQDSERNQVQPNDNKIPEKTLNSTKDAGQAREKVSGPNKDQDYFDQISKVVEDLMLHFNFACRSAKFKEHLEHSGINLNQNDQPIADMKTKVRILFWIDLLRCYKGLGHPINLKNKEGLGMLYFYVRSTGMSPLTHSQIGRITDPFFYRSIEDFIKNLSENLPDVFLVAHLFGEFDEKRKKQYLVQLYRFASLTAKADNVVTPEESEWLSSIMQLQSDGSNTRITEEDEEESDTAEPIVVKKTSAKSPRAKTELNNLIGLESVKQEVEALTNYIHIQKAREEKGLATSPISYHCVFTGNPGTGKTTVARILAKIYKSLGVVTKGHLVETDRSGLVAEYVGQTAVKTNKIIDSALDGVLFIDEAYSLISSSENDYGKEAIATLLKRMEDDRNRLVVILAGYTKEMKDFIDSNPGLQSRFNRYIEFPDYNADELYQIFCKQLKQFEYTISEDAAEALKGYLAYAVAHKDQNFGNARFVRNLFERTLQQQANRLSREVNLTTQKLSEIIKEDLPIAL